MKKYILTSIVIYLMLGCSTSQQITILTPHKIDGNTVTVFTTADDTNLRLTLTDKLTFKPAVQPLESEISVFVNPEKQYQTFIGIGGAITDASAEVFAKLPKDKQQELLSAYYDKDKGIGYTLARTNIHSCDFSSGSYTYVSDEDKNLTTFNIQHDKQFRIPLIKKAIESTGGNLLLFASPWSPPAFMKNNKDMLHGGKLLPEYYQSWAAYFTKFIKAYQSEGIPVWGITLQNEPMATQRWESCIFTAEEERDFLKNFLGPTMVNEGLGDKKIIVWDHNRDLMNHRADIIFSDPEASKYTWGLGFHWYESWSGGEEMYNNVGKVNESYPDKHLLFTEGCAETFRPNGYQSWKNAERYGRSMINDFNNGTVGWTDWNILLDENGGPNHVENFCFAPMHANTKTGELIYTPSYYYIGHFSKFIRPNAKRISTASSRSQLLSTSFINTDGKIVTVVMNQSDLEIKYKLYVGSNVAEVVILPHAIQSLIY
ncbi:MAG TPA: glycoside hydrolase family 30 protein [Ignavibacteriaceae bacterium]|nr:glycoside hydrolase family 30 protein [Ignavibacteriaceae bacterium]